MSDASIPDSAVVERCQTILAHAWMVRTFVKHSPEVEEFPELMGIVRNVFDLCRSVESRVSDPPAYVHQLRKKLSKLKTAAAQFAVDAPLASDHTNFRQAVSSIAGCVRDLESILGQFPPVRPPATSFLPPVGSGKLAETSPPQPLPDDDVE
jgi:hypothetical protein